MAKLTQLYPGVGNFGRVYTVKRDNRFPIDINSVKHSLADLEDYVSNSFDAYPGQVVAIDDDLTSQIFVNDEERGNIGIYYIYHDDTLNNTNKLWYKKLAFGKSVEEFFKNPWQVMYDNDETEPDVYNINEKIDNNILRQYADNGLDIDIRPYK